MLNVGSKINIGRALIFLITLSVLASIFHCLYIWLTFSPLHSHVNQAETLKISSFQKKIFTRNIINKTIPKVHKRISPWPVARHTINITERKWNTKGYNRSFITATSQNSSLTASSYTIATSKIPHYEAISETINLTQVWQTVVGTSRIPFIVHQTYKNTDLPAHYYMSLLGLLRSHRFRDPRRHPISSPTIYNRSKRVLTEKPIDPALSNERYDYYFWTDASIAEYVADNENRSSGFGVFKKMRVKLETADAIRYFALYEYGGVYLDMDMEVVRPLSAFLARGYPCVVPQENPIQANGPRVTNCFLLCRPKYDTCMCSFYSSCVLCRFAVDRQEITAVLDSRAYQPFKPESVFTT